MIMTESVDSLVTVSSQDLWTEICSSLPHPDQNEESNNAFADSFADSYVHVMENQMEVTGPSLQMNEKPWVPLKDSELYLASLGTRSYFQGCHPLTILTCVSCLLPCFCCQRPSGTTTSAADKAFLKASAANNRGLDQSGALLSTIEAFRKALPDLLAAEEMGLQERRLMRIKGLSQEVTSKDILHTLSQAKKESWDRFLQEKSESEFYMEGTDSDESTLEYLKRWLQPEKVAVSSEEIQFLIPLGAPPEKQEAEEEEEEPTPVEQ